MYLKIQFYQQKYKNTTTTTHSFWNEVLFKINVLDFPKKLQ